MAKFDVAVVGGGPAGSACAAFLARWGWEVLLVERAPEPAPKVCGEFICPQAFEILEAIGARRAVEEEPHRAVTGMVLAAPDGRRIETRFPARGSSSAQRRHGISMRRTRFDGILQENASRRGACVWRGARLVGLRAGSGEAVLSLRTERRGPPLPVRARLVIGADGRFSSVARWAGLSLPAPGGVRAVVHGYYEGVRGLGDKGEMHILAGGAYCALDPMADGSCNVSYVDDLNSILSWRRRKSELLREVFRKSPHLGEMFSRAQGRGEPCLLAPLRVRTREPYAHRLMLVGDAAGFYDPFTGEGIYAALKTAEMAAGVADEVLGRDDLSARRLARYARLRSRWLRPKMRVWRLFQQIIRRERLVNRFGKGLSRHPELADLLVGLTGNYVPPRALLQPFVLLRLLEGLVPGIPQPGPGI